MRACLQHNQSRDQLRPKPHTSPARAQAKAPAAPSRGRPLAAAGPGRRPWAGRRRPRLWRVKDARQEEGRRWAARARPPQEPRRGALSGRRCHLCGARKALGQLGARGRAGRSPATSCCRRLAGGSSSRMARWPLSHAHSSLKRGKRARKEVGPTARPGEAPATQGSETAGGGVPALVRACSARAAPRARRRPAPRGRPTLRRRAGPSSWGGGGEHVQGEAVGGVAGRWVRLRMLLSPMRATKVLAGDVRGLWPQQCAGKARGGAPPARRACRAWPAAARRGRPPPCRPAGRPAGAAAPAAARASPGWAAGAAGC
jgi:hypothetical protein